MRETKAVAHSVILCVGVCVCVCEDWVVASVHLLGCVSPWMFMNECG